VCNDFTPALLNALGIHNSVTGEKGAANGALEKMAIGRLLVSASTPLTTLGESRGLDCAADFEAALVGHFNNWLRRPFSAGAR